jgi:hypothetical protein
VEPEVLATTGQHASWGFRTSIGNNQETDANVSQNNAGSSTNDGAVGIKRSKNKFLSRALEA